jgi:hypothetical protein
LKSFCHEKSCSGKILCVFAIKTHKPNLQEAVSSRKEPPQKISCRFVMKTHKSDLQEAVLLRKEPPKKNFMPFRHEKT